ncbi:hypothetical protein T10_13495 [Trichinella papuae]|uniref:Uncharacterized protein n=1 Tax=Trichinella papuae TaxID=268474 RepID=A0A0V1MGU7_9BILA|nr:hypothetical protein T10_13495 [Trichinella papuae]
MDPCGCYSVLAVYFTRQTARISERRNFTINHRTGCDKLSEVATFASASQKAHGAATLTGDLAENLSENSAMPPALAPTQMLIIMQ